MCVCLCVCLRECVKTNSQTHKNTQLRLSKTHSQEYRMNYNLLRAIKNLYFGITANIYANGHAKVCIMLVAIVKLYISSFPYGILLSKLSVTRNKMFFDT